MLSRRKQKQVMIAGYIVMLPLAIAIVLVATGKGSFTASAVEDDKIYVESAEAPEKAVSERQSGMPCENPEQFERWYAEYEQTTGEEKEVLADKCTEELSGILAGNEEKPTAAPEIQTLREQEIYATSCEALVSNSIYRIDGEVIAPEIQQKLYDTLDEAGIAYWYEIGLCQMYQESRGQQYAENPNGLDKGLYQFRVTYWGAPESIFDVDAQIRAYTQNTAARLNAGLSVDEVISRHKTSDWAGYIDWDYVAQVREWLGKMEVIQ